MTKRKFIKIILIISLSLIDVIASINTEKLSILRRPLREINKHRCIVDNKKDYDIVTEYKRLPENRYISEYKRYPDYRYSFGIGKRWFNDNTQRNLPYSFGIGKRENIDKINQQFSNDYVIDDVSNDNNIFENEKLQIKRVPLRKYNFGIGKRDIHDDDQQNDIEINHEKLNDDNQQVWDEN